MSDLCFYISSRITLAAAPLDKYDRVSQIPLDILAYIRINSVYSSNGNVTPRTERKWGIAEPHYVPTKLITLVSQNKTSSLWDPFLIYL